MSKIKLLLDVVEDMRSLADSIQALCDASVETEQVEVVEKASKSKKTATKEKAPVTLEMVRGMLAKKSQQGKTAEVREIIAKYGATKLSEISAEHYADILKDGSVL